MVVRRFRLRWLLLIVFCYPLWSAADSIEPAAITIIIDDLGYNLNQGMRAVALPGPVTFAVLPYSPHSKKLAEAAHNRDKEVMLHMPMDNGSGLSPGPGVLTAKQDQTTFRQQLEQAIQAIPHLQGINNHMGSSLTQNTQRMKWVMASLKNRSLYFVDSRTTALSVAGATARRQHIPSLERDVFLDHDPTPAAIDKQFKRLIKLAKKQGSAVAIGHPYPSTLGYLENVIPKLDAMGIFLVSPSGLLMLKQAETRNTETHSDKALVIAALPTNRSHCTITEQLERRIVTC